MVLRLERREISDSEDMKLVVSSGIVFFLLGIVIGVLLKTSKNKTITLGAADVAHVQFLEVDSRLEISAVLNGKRKIGMVDHNRHVPVSFDFSNKIENVIWSYQDSDGIYATFDSDGNGVPESMMELGDENIVYAVEMRKSVSAQSPARK